ncbi:serine--tRNA ligase [Candidatus Ruminimicrobium bovinum]|uniref:serine--tRNA ligase n=1 Tax=Candidatus Ruminimicrobium bovinum TaxID=3242779 RepID=UPI0039B90E04
MLDIKLFRDNLDFVKEGLAKRGFTTDFDNLLNLDDQRRKIILEIDQARLKRNTDSEQIGKLKREGKEPDAKLLQELEQFRTRIQEKERFLLTLENQIEDILLRIPNIPDETTPVGKSDKDNVVVRTVGDIPQFSFKPKHHWEIGTKLGILDFETASKISGSRFAVLKNEGCALERAIISFFLDTHKQKGYTEIMTPYLVNQASMRGTGQLPKFEEELFKCQEDKLYLIPTAEVSVTNIHRDEVLDEKDLTKKYVSYSACFRREAGSYGKDTKGLIRNHQFNKVELVKFTKPENSMAELEALTNDAENVLQLLKIPYRVMALCTGDIGFSSCKTYDLEAWMSGENTYREISSCSNFKDFQARRMNIKYKSATSKKREYVHTLNGSGVAVGRTFATILENYQQEDGSVVIPEVLRKYTGFDIIKPK